MPNYFSVKRLYAELSSGSIVYSYRIKVFSICLTNNKRHFLDMNAAYHIIRYFSESSMKDLSSRFSQSFGLLLFQIFSEISQSHISLLQEGIVHGEGSTHALWLVALLSKLQVFAEHRAVIWMGTVFDNLLGTA